MLIIALVTLLVSGTELCRFAGSVQMCCCYMEVTCVMVNSMDQEEAGNLYWPTYHNRTVLSILASSLSFNLQSGSSVLTVIYAL